MNFCGKKNNVYEYLVKSDIFIYPSIWEEAFGISIIEAMGLGIPVIATKKGGIPEIIVNNENGFLVESNNEEELANTIEKVISYIKNNDIDKLEKNAIDTAKRFNINNTIKNLEKVYKELLVK